MVQARVEMQATILPNGKVLVDADRVRMRTQAPPA